MKTIGVLGGMGPESTALFYQFLIRECQKQFGACKDEDYPEIIIDSIPIPDVVETVGNDKTIISALKKGVEKLITAGADFIVVPCNTVTPFVNQLESGFKIPIVNIVSCAVEKIKNDSLQKIVVFSTGFTAETGLYKTSLETAGIKSLLLSANQQNKLTCAILNIMAGKKGEEVTRPISDILKDVIAQDVEAIILGCTDLSVINFDSLTDLPIYDSSRILAESAVSQIVI